MVMDTEFIVRLIWLVIGLGLGYALGTSITALRYTRRMYNEIHDCHVILLENVDDDQESENDADQV
jgi:hypothetical protein